MELPEDVLTETESLGSAWASDLDGSDGDTSPCRDARALPQPKVPVHFMEVFSNPRIAPYVSGLGMRVGPSIDLGTGWNLALRSCQNHLLQLLAVLQPFVLMLSPPCTVFSQVQNSMKNRRKCQRTWKKHYEQGLLLWRSALCLFKEQCRQGRKAVLEHPWLASSWALSITEEVANTPGVFQTIFDQCLLGLVTTAEQKPVRKRTRFLSNLQTLEICFSTRCTPETCSHLPVEHAWLQGREGGASRCRSAQVYPADFCRGMARSVLNYTNNVAAPALPEAQVAPADDADSEADLPSPAS